MKKINISICIEGDDVCVSQETSNKTIIIGGNPFDYKPKIGNDGTTCQQGDIALNGWLSDGSFGARLIYIGVNGGSGENASDWQVESQL